MAAEITVRTYNLKNIHLFLYALMKPMDSTTKSMVRASTMMVEAAMWEKKIPFDDPNVFSGAIMVEFNKIQTEKVVEIGLYAAFMNKAEKVETTIDEIVESSQKD